MTFPLLRGVPAAAAQAPPAAQAGADRGAPSRIAATTSGRSKRVLTLAVKSGADKLALQMRASEPGSLFVIDTGRTRGFDLQGYGVFFDVDVPMMKQSVLWSTRSADAAGQARRSSRTTVPTPPPGPARDLGDPRDAPDAGSRGCSDSAAAMQPGACRRGCRR